MDISAHGCLAVVPEPVEVGEKLVLTNLGNRKEVTSLNSGGGTREREGGNWVCY